MRPPLLLIAGGCALLALVLAVLLWKWLVVAATGWVCWRAPAARKGRTVNVGDLCPGCGRPFTLLADWQWALRVNDVTTYWRGERALDAAYSAADSRIDEGRADHVAILLSTSGGVSWGIADTRDVGGAWVVGRERWQREGRAA